MAEQLKIGDNVRLKNSPSSFNDKTQGPMMVIQGSLGQKINIPIETYEITATITHQDDFVLCKWYDIDMKCFKQEVFNLQSLML